MKKTAFLFLVLGLVLLHFAPAQAENTVTVTYNGTTATVLVDDNVAPYLTITQSGAHVSIAQSTEVTEEITYTLSGSSTNGEFYMSGSYKATIELNGLTLTNTTPVYSGAAIHIQNSKRINVKVVTGTTNTLTDAANGEQKGCLYVKGHAEFKQQGTLNIVGNTKHGIKAGEYITVKNATINITSAVGDGISCNQYFLMESGAITISGTDDDGIQCDLDGETSTGMTTDHEDEDSGNIYISGGVITINCTASAAKGIKSVGDIYVTDNANINVTTTGNGTWDTTDLEAKASCGVNADGNITITGGTMTLTANGSGGKGMGCDGLMTISGGDITVVTSGGLYYNNGTTEYTSYSGNTDQINSNYYCSPKGIKAGTKVTSSSSTTYYGGIDINGGTIKVTTVGKNGEGIESKNYLNITDGEICVNAQDDGINSAQDLTITGGYVYSRGSNNDGIDANGNVFIQGGLVYAISASSPEVAIGANTEENKKFYFSGGTLIAIGGLERGSTLSQTCYQSSSWSQNTWYSMTFGSTVIAFQTPASGGTPMVVSASSTPTLKSGVTVNGGTSIFQGRCYLDASCNGGSNVSLSQYNGEGGGGNPPGPGNTYTITATANPTAGGTVSGAGTYNRFSTCTLVATANSGYTFTNWTKNGSVVSTNATYSFQVTGNASYVANFTANPYTITATADPTEGGTVNGTGSYYGNTSCTLTANPNIGYSFSYWTLNGNQISTNPTYTFTVTGNATFIAHFRTTDPHSVSCEVTEHGTISANPTTAYNGESITLSAMPDSGYALESWSVQDGDGNNIPVTNNQFIMPDSPVTVSATFGTGYSVSLAAVMNGSISASPTFNTAGATVTLTATPATGYAFDSWVVYKTDDVNTLIAVTGNTFTMPAFDVTVSAIFSKLQGGDVTIGNGTNTSSSLPTNVWYKYTTSQQIYTAAEIGDAGTITAISFNYNGNATSGARTLDIYMTHTTSSSLSSWVTVTSSSKVYSGSQTFTSSGWHTITLDTPFEYNGTSNIMITVDDNTGSYTGSSGRAFYAYSTGSTRAIYNQNDYYNQTPLSPQTSPNYSPTTSSSNSQIKFTKEIPGNEPYLSVSPTTLSGFIYAEEDGPSEAQTVMVIGRNIEDDLTVTAPADYEISNDGNIYASILNLTASSGNVQTMVYVRLKAGLAEGNYLDESLSFSSGSTTQSIILNGKVSESLGAYYYITVTANPIEGGSVTGGGRYHSDVVATLTAEPSEGYLFMGWEENGNIISTTPTLSFTVDADRTLVAQFNQSVTQTQTFSIGWGWVSFYINLQGQQGLQLLEQAYGENGFLIKSQTAFAQYEDGAWDGNLNSIEVEKMYQINTTGTGTLSIEASVVNPEDHPISIQNGWNWIGYPTSTEATVADALSGFDSDDEDVLKSFNAVATYIDGYGWWGTLDKMTPGKGYMYHSKASENKTLVYSQNRRGIQLHKANNDNLHWNVDGLTYCDNASIIACIDAKDLTLSEDLEVGAFVNGECRGSAHLLYVEPLNQYLAFLTVYGNDEEQIQFMVYDGIQTIPMKEVITYKNNLIAGSASQPVVLHQGTSDGFTLYPNPVKAGEHIMIQLPEDMRNGLVEIIDATGRIVLRGDDVHVISTPNAPGVYTVRITDENGTTKNKKLIVK